MPKTNASTSIIEEEKPRIVELKGIRLYDYQVRALREILSMLRQGEPVLLEMPTGGCPCPLV